MGTWSSHDPRPPEPIDEAIARLGRLASPRLLSILGSVAAVGVAGVLLIDWQRWPIASLLGALACFAAWGLIEHRDPGNSGLLLRVTQQAVVALGAIATITGLLGMLFWALGPAPIL